jgi:hypothetical protein
MLTSDPFSRDSDNKNADFSKDLAFLTTVLIIIKFSVNRTKKHPALLANKFSNCRSWIIIELRPLK